MAAVAALAAGCAGVRSSGDFPSGELHGLRAQLSARAGPALSLTVDGSVGGTPALVRLDVASALSRVAAGCFKSAPSSRGTVRFQRPAGAMVTLQEVTLEGVVVAGRRLPKRQWAVEPSVAADCVVWVGTDVLGRAAIDVEPGTAQVRINPGRPRSEYVGLPLLVAGSERAVVELDRDPTSDRLLVPASVRFGDSEVAVPFILATAAERSTLGAPVAAAARLPAAPAYAPRRLDLAPGFGLERVTLLHHPSWTNRAAAGELGADVWGRFELRIDLEAGVLLLSRPRKLMEEGRQVCPADRPQGRPSEEDCARVRAKRGAGGDWRVLLSVETDLPDGATMWLDLEDAPGSCRVGFSLWPADRGVTVLAHLPATGLPWPDCEQALRATTKIGPGLLENDGPIEGCPGDCVMFGRRSSDEVECQCSTYGALTEPPQPDSGKSKKRKVRMREAPEPADPR